MSAIPVFVISLQCEEQRRAALMPHLKGRGFDACFLDAIDGRQMDVLSFPAYRGSRRRAAHGRDLKPGELGCILSHRAAYQYIIDQNIPHALLVEDDVRLHENTRASLEAFLAKNIDYDIVRLLGSPKVAKGRMRKIVALYGDHYLVRLLATPGGTHATLISRQGAQTLLRMTETFSFPIDTIFGRTWETGINAYCIQPGLATQDLSFDSAIGEARHDKTTHLPPLETFKFKFTRPVFKIGEAIGKRRSYYAHAVSDLAIRKKFR